MIYVLDTHALLWYVDGGVLLGDNARTILLDEESRLIVPSIILAEARYACAKKRVMAEWETILMTVEEDARCRIEPLSLEVVVRLPTGLEIHDGIICATALLYKDLLGEDVRVITREDQIVGSGIVKAIW